MSLIATELCGFSTSLSSHNGNNFSVCMFISGLTLKNDVMILAKKKNGKSIDDNCTCLECLQVQHLISTLFYDLNVLFLT